MTDQKIMLRFESTRTSTKNGFSVALNSGLILGDHGLALGGIDFDALPFSSRYTIAQRGFQETAVDSLARCTTAEDCVSAIKRMVLRLIAGTWAGKDSGPKDGGAAIDGRKADPRIKIMLALPSPTGAGTYADAITSALTKKIGSKPKTLDKDAAKAWDIAFRAMVADISKRPATIARVDAEIERLRLVAEANARIAAELLAESEGQIEDLLAGF